MLREILASSVKASALEIDSINPLTGSTIVIHNLADGTSSGDAVNKGQLDTKINSTLINANNGVAGLDSGGKIPIALLPASLMEYQGVWDASTNVPALADGTGTAGFFYRVNVAGTQDLGSGPLTFVVGDWVMYDGAVWQLAHAGADNVVSVNGQAGVVSLVASDIPYDNTSSGFAATDTQGAIDELNGLVIKKDGSVAFTGAQSMGSHKLTNVTDPTAAQDAATKNYVDSTIATDLAGYLPLSGTANDVDMNNHSITNASDVHAFTIEADSLMTAAGGLSITGGAFAVSMGVSVDFGDNAITDVADPTNPQDVATKNYVDTAITASSGANTTLSNLTSPTAINQDLIFNTGATASLKTRDEASGDSHVLKITTGVTSAGNSGSVSISSGNATGGDSGNINLIIGGTVGTPGHIIFTDGSQGNVGDVWTSIDGVGRGSWITPSYPYLLLAGGTMSGNIDMNYAAAIQHATDVRSEQINVIDGSDSSALTIQNSAGNGVISGNGVFIQSQGLPIDAVRDLNLQSASDMHVNAGGSYFSGTIAGTATTVVIQANNSGNANNGLVFTFDGVNSIDANLATWNTSNPSNQIFTRRGDGTQIPSAGTITFNGSGVFSVQSQLDMSSQPITSLLDPVSAQDAATKNYVDSQIVSASGANVSLSNLSSVAINTSLLPNIDADWDLGSASKRWANAYFFVVRDGSNTTSLDANQRFLVDSAGHRALGYDDRQLRFTDGTTAMLDWSSAGVLDAKTNLLSNVADPVSAQDAATKNYVDVTATTAILATVSSLYLPFAGGNMTGAIDMGANQINDMADPTSAQDAVTKNYADTTFLKLSGGTMSSSINMGGSGLTHVSAISDPSGLNSLSVVSRQLIFTDGSTVMLDWSGAGVLDAKTNLLSNVADPVSAQDAATKNYVDTSSAAAPVWQKHTVAFSDLAAVGVNTNSVTLFALGAKQVIHGVVVKHSASFTGGTISGYQVSVGVLGDLQRYSSDFDVLQAVGSSTAQASQDLSPEDFSSSTNILITAVSVGDTLDDATAGMVDVWVSVATLP